MEAVRRRQPESVSQTQSVNELQPVRVRVSRNQSVTVSQAPDWRDSQKWGVPFQGLEGGSVSRTESDTVRESVGASQPFNQ